MYLICIPSRDEERTIGVLLWKIREVMTKMRRDFHVFVLDDGSRDGTGSLLDRYQRIMPLTVLRHDQPLGYGPALEKLLRAAAGFSSYPKRDAIVTMQADFTEHPEHLRAMARTFEGGADIVLSEPGASKADDDRNGERRSPPRATALARWLGRVILGSGAEDLRGFRTLRVVVVRKALQAVRNRPLIRTDGWAANAELARVLLPHARRVESISCERRYDIRTRSSRFRFLRTLRQILRLRTLAAALALALLSTWPGATRAQTANSRAQSSLLVLDTLAAGSHRMANIPFGPGEELRYRLRASFVGGGEALMAIGETEDVNGFATWPVTWKIRGSALGFGMNDTLSSWLDTETLVSRRFTKSQNSGKRIRAYDFFPEERLVHRLDYDTTWALPTALPLDDLSFLYFVRAMPLRVGETHTLNRYFKDDGNPVILKILRRDEIEVPAGIFNTIVVRPILPGNRLFGEGSDAEVHISDDERRLVVYMRADMGLFLPELEMFLESVVAPTPPGESGR